MIPKRIETNSLLTTGNDYKDLCSHSFKFVFAALKTAESH